MVCYGEDNIPQRFLPASILEFSDDAIIAITLDGVIQTWNNAAQRMFGYTEEEAIGQPITIIGAPELYKGEEHIRRRLAAGERIAHYETVRVSKAGKRIDVSLTISPIKDEEGRIIGASKILRDITERRRAEVALRESEERLRLAQWAARIGTFEWNIRTGVNTWTPELEAIYGLPPGGFGGTLSAFENLVHPDDRGRVMGLVDKAVKTLQPTTGEWRVVWPDGSVHWVAARAQVFTNEAGEPSRMVGVNIDITERKFAEEKLAATNERLHLAIEAGSVGGWDWNIKTNENVWFGEAHAQVGMTADETLGSRQEFWDRVHEDDRERLMDAMRVARNKLEAFSEDFRVVWQDGTVHWLRSRGQYYYGADGKPERMLGISVDITQSKQAEQMLRESEERFRLVANSAPVMIWMSGVDRLCTYLNQAWLDFTGRSLEAELGDGWKEGLHPEDLKRSFDIESKAVERREPYQMHYRVRRHDGEYRWILNSGVPRFNEDGSFAGFIGSAIDVTERKLAEQALSTMSQKLIEAQEEERARIARELHDDIDQRLALLAVSLESLQQNPPSSKTELLQEIGRASKQVGDLVSDVQVISHQLHSSKLEYLGLEPAAAGLCRELSERQGVKIDFCSDNISKDLPKEISLCLFRVLQEALQNAIKHSGSRHFEVSLSARSSEIELTVRDSGIGFDPQEAMKGRGFGLTSMNERLKLVNGALSIDSQLQRGTMIQARVPFSPRPKSIGAVG